MLDYIVLPHINLNSDTKKGIFIIFIFAFGFLCLFGLFELAGTVGEYLAHFQALIFGWGKWLFPVILLSLAFFIYNDDKYHIKGTNYLGLFIFLFVFEALLHFFIDFTEWREMALEGIGGGFFGFYIALAFHNILGFWGSLLTLISLMIISLLLLLDTSLSRLIGSESLIAKIVFPVKIIFAKIFKQKEYVEDEKEYEKFQNDSMGIVSEAEYDKENSVVEQCEMGFSKKSISEIPKFISKKSIKTNKEDIDDNEENNSDWNKNKVDIDLPLNLLTASKGKPTSGDIKNNMLIIQRTLENFGIIIEVGEVSIGPTVTQYTFKPADGIKLSRVVALNNDLALALAMHPIRIEAPIPGKALVGIEVPNQSKATIGIREVLESLEFKKNKGNLKIALGKDVSGEYWSYDIAKMPHLLVAGATNSGKSVCLNSIIISLLYNYNPSDLRFIMVDPKRVELPVYNGISHLLAPVITDVEKTINALQWCLSEMDRRFDILSEKGKRNIESYNKTAEQKMPYIVVIIDELADLMVVASKDIESGIIRLAQMARAVGIHLILATQRPSVDVITGLIKANMPARIAFSVASAVDSKTILDSLGAEKLLGQGDMLFVTAEISKPKRIQGTFVSDHEIKKICNYIKEKCGSADYIKEITEKQKVKGVAGVGISNGRDNEDDLLGEAKEIVINMGKASASLLQRRLRVGYARAASILDQLEELGIVGQPNGSKPREILISKEQYESMNETGISGVSIHDQQESKIPENYLDGEQSESMPEFKSENKEEETQAEVVESLSEKKEKHIKNAKKEEEDDDDEYDGMLFAK